MARFRHVILAMLLSVHTWAQMPHEVLLLVNRQSQPSLRVANTFVENRKIPECNIVYLDIPESIYGGTATITPEQFSKLIWEPATEAAKTRGIERQILAWVYSVDFPIRVKTDSYARKQMAVGGLTYLRNVLPDLGLVEEGTYLSKLFAGPNEQLPLSLPALSLGRFKHGLGADAKIPSEVSYLQEGLGDQMPLPSMMLGYTGEKGNDVQTVLDTLARGMVSDHRGLRSGFYFVVSGDVRSKCRDWQYASVVKEMKTKRIIANVTTNFPAGEENVMGLMMGAESVDPSRIGSFAPGAMAEHLTSWSAEFQRPQTKMTEWLKAGATGSAGSVVEPYSNANKFTSARFYVHYVSGCTMLESFYQSIACPLQTLLLGDPMAKPYSFPFSVKVLGADTIDSDFTYVALANSSVKGANFVYSFLLDGKEIRETSSDPSVYLRTMKLSDGFHELRAVARVNHLVQYGAFSDKTIIIKRMGRFIAFLPSVQKLDEHKHGFKVKVEGDEIPEKLQLVCGEEVLDEKAYRDDAVLQLDEQMLGEGPSRIRAVAVYGDGMHVSSEPLRIDIAY